MACEEKGERTCLLFYGGTTGFLPSLLLAVPKARRRTSLVIFIAPRNDGEKHEPSSYPGRNRLLTGPSAG